MVALAREGVSAILLLLPLLLLLLMLLLMGEAVEGVCGGG